MREKSESKLKETMVRLSADQHERLVRSAHDARLPRGVFLAKMFIDGRQPNAAPPLPADLPSDAQELLKICHALVSNLTQLDAHAAAAGDPICRLCGDAGMLAKLSRRAVAVGVDVKSGELSSAHATELVAALARPSQSINDLARALNSDERRGQWAWHQALDALHRALPKLQSAGSNDV